MKEILIVIVVLGVLTLAAFLLTGCASLFPGFNTAEAQAIAEKREAELRSTFERVEQLESAVVAAREAYDKAVREGDQQAVLEAGKVLASKLAELDLGKQDLDNVATAFESAVQDFKDAKGAGEYLNVILGSLGGILGMFGIGMPMVRRRDEALSVTAANAELALDEKSLAAFKIAQVDSFKNRPGALAVLRKARGK